MLRNYISAALGNIGRNRLYAAISVLSLAIGMAAVLLTFLFVRDELTFDHFVPGHQRIFVVETRYAVPGGPPQVISSTDSILAAWMRTEFPEVRRVARYDREAIFIQQGDFAVTDNVGWVDPDFFAIFRLKALAGDLDGALRRPDGLVLTRSAARKYFGAESPLGRTLHVKLNTVHDQLYADLKVGAVIEDLPNNANIAVTMFASDLGRVSPESRADAGPYMQGRYWIEDRTYVELAEARQAARVDQRLAALVRQRMFPPPVLSETPFGRSLVLSLVPIGRMHLMPDLEPEIPSGNPTLLAALGAMALLILVAAGLNFVNLATARAARRGVEVGVRKVSGAGRHHLILQFLGESLIYSALSAILAVALVEAALPVLDGVLGIHALDGLLQRRIGFAYWSDPQLIGLIAGMVLLVGLLAGLYPALILSAFRPSAAFTPAAAAGAGGQVLRRGLVVVQFALLIGLLSSILVIANQTRFAMDKGTGFEVDRVVRLAWPDCRGDFYERLQRIRGIEAIACASRLAMGHSDRINLIKTPEGRVLQVGVDPVDYGFFELYGIRPLAGRLPDRGHGGDGLPYGAANGALPRATVVNRAMVRALGLASPQAAVGAVFQVPSGPGGTQPLQVIGVIPDYAFDLTKVPVEPAFFPVVPDADGDMNVKVAPDHIPETLAAIDAAWKASGAHYPLRRRFTSEYLSTIYAGVIHQAWLIGALAGVAVLIAAMGLFGTAAFLAERRTKEIGVRKAMGASTADILRLMLWSFSQPVLLANLLAWPAAWLALHRWLEGFARHIPLEPWMFLAAALAALAIALATVLAHTLRVASAKPVGALRYE